MAYGESELQMVLDKIKACGTGYVEGVWMGVNGAMTVVKITDNNSFASYPFGHVVLAYDNMLIYMGGTTTTKEGVVRYKKGAGVRVIVPTSAVVGVTREKFSDIRAEYQLSRSN